MNNEDENQDNQNTNHDEAFKEQGPDGALEKTQKFKRTYFQILIGCLIAAASVAVLAVLVGSFSDILARALGTIGLVALHAMLSFSYISSTEKLNQKDGGRSIELFSNTVFSLIVVSFITSIFGIWQLLDGDLVLKLYLFYAVVLFATLHADVLYRIRGFEKRIDTIVSINYGFMGFVVLMLSGVIFMMPADMGEIYYRVLAASGIVDATMTITAIILHKLYLQKHPELSEQFNSTTGAQSANFWRNPFVVILLIFLGLQIIGSIIAALL